MHLNLAVVLTQHQFPGAQAHDKFRVEFFTLCGTARKLDWLTYSDALRRAMELRGRGYKANVYPMFPE
jgi:hypothetical protein